MLQTKGGYGSDVCLKEKTSPSPSCKDVNSSAI